MALKESPILATTPPQSSRRELSQEEQKERLIQVTQALVDLGGTMSFDAQEDLANLVSDIVLGDEEVEVLSTPERREDAIKRSRQRAHQRKPKFLGFLRL